MSDNEISTQDLISVINSTKNIGGDIHEKAKKILNYRIKDYNYIERNIDGDILFASKVTKLKNTITGAIITGRKQGLEQYTVLCVDREDEEYYYYSFIKNNISGRVQKNFLIKFSNIESENKLKKKLEDRAMLRAELNNNYYTKEI